MQVADASASSLRVCLAHVKTLDAKDQDQAQDDDTAPVTPPRALPGSGGGGGGGGGGGRGRGSHSPLRVTADGEVRPAGELVGARVMLFNKPAHAWQDGRVVGQNHGAHTVDVRLSNGWVVEAASVADVRVMVLPAAEGGGGGGDSPTPARYAAGLHVDPDAASVSQGPPGHNASVSTARTGWSDWVEEEEEGVLNQASVRE